MRFFRRPRLRRCKHKDTIAVYGVDGPLLICNDCGRSSPLSIEEWRSLSVEVER